MDLQHIKYHTCTQDHGQGILLVDIESETLPHKGVLDNKLYYYCMLKHHIFSVSRQLQTTQDEQPEPSDILR